MPIPVVCKYSCCTHFSLPLLPSIGGPATELERHQLTWEDKPHLMLMETPAEPSRTWIKHGKPKYWVLLYLEKMFYHDSPSQCQQDSSDAEIEQASPFQNALVVWRTSLGWAWANGFMWFDSLCLNQLPLVCSAVITCCVHPRSISELCVKASLCKHRPPRQAVLSQLLALVYPLFQCPIYDMSKESD